MIYDFKVKKISKEIFDLIFSQYPVQIINLDWHL